MDRSEIFIGAKLGLTYCWQTGDACTVLEIPDLVPGANWNEQWVTVRHNGKPFKVHPYNLCGLEIGPSLAYRLGIPPGSMFVHEWQKAYKDQFGEYPDMEGWTRKTFKKIVVTT